MNTPQTVADWAIWALSILAILAILWIAVTYLNLPIPPWAYTIVGIVVLVCLAIWAIRMVSRA